MGKRSSAESEPPGTLVTMARYLKPSPPAELPGKWETIFVSGSGDVEAKVKETFAKNKANHKLEFFSKLDLNVQDDCTFRVYGELLSSYISYKSKSSTDSRWFYRSGELATTAAEKLRRLN